MLSKTVITTIKMIILFAIVYIIIALLYGHKEYFNSRHHALKKPQLTKQPRVVVSFSTLPSRVGNIPKVVNSILKNTIVPDIIYINIPKFSKRENKEYNINEDIMKDIMKDIKNEHKNKVKFNFISNDYGPVTKLYPTLLTENDPETIIICVDDDKEYDPWTIEHLLNSSEYFGDSCVCVSGWNYINLKFIALPITINVPNYVKRVDILQCYNGVLYKRKFFQEDFERYLNIKCCFTTDDIMISKYLNSKQIKILAVPFVNRHKNIGSNSSTLGIFNLLNNSWIKCIDAKI
jgi:hypothetical protein